MSDCRRTSKPTEPMFTPSTAPTPRSWPTRWPSIQPLRALHARVAGRNQHAEAPSSSSTPSTSQYGHRSIADLAHIPMAIERLSLLAAIALSRRAALGRPGTQHALPGFPQVRLVHAAPRSAARPSRFAAADSRPLYRLQPGQRPACSRRLEAVVPCPEAMKPDAYERTLKARAFDVARYLPAARRRTLRWARSRQRAYAGNAGFPPADQRVCGDPQCSAKSCARPPLSEKDVNPREQAYRHLMESLEGPST